MEKKDLTTYLAEHAKTEKASFHMPGHKGSEFFARLGYGETSQTCQTCQLVPEENWQACQFSSGTNWQVWQIADHDVTEIPGADDLRHPEGIIKAIADKYAVLYGSRRAFISVNGSSALIMAAIMTCVKPEHKLIAAADSHISVGNGVELAGADLVYVKPQMFDMGFGGAAIAPGSISGGENGLPGGLRAKDVAEALDAEPCADAVILPSPNYFGIVSDIKSIADEVHKRGRILIVDQAHGAHLKMFADSRCCGMLPVPAEECGADIVIVSTHKTMASFTQTAVANIFSDQVDPEEYERKLLMLESTSPSYVLMESLAVNADIMEKYGSELAASWRNDLDWFYDNVRLIPGIRVITRDSAKSAAYAADPTDAAGIDFDDTKIVIDFSTLGMSGEQAEEILIEKGIYPEFHTGSIVMCLTGIGNVRQDYEILLDALSEIAQNRQLKEKGNN